MFPIAVNGSAALTGTLAAGVATNVDLAVDAARRVVLLIKNTGGSNALGTTAVSLSPNGTLFAENTALGTAIGSLAAGATALVELDGLACHTLRLALTSSSGTTYAVEARGDATGAPTMQVRVNGTLVGGVATTGAFSATSLTATGLTATRVPVVSTGGLLVDDSGLTFNTTTNALTVAGAVAAGAASSVTVDDATTNASTVCATLAHTTSGTAAANIGAGLLFAAEDAAGNTESAVQIDGILTPAPNASEVSALVVKTRTGGGALTEAFRVAGSGLCTAVGGFACAASTALTGAGALAVEATGALSLGVNASTTSIVVGQATVAPSFAGGVSIAANKAVTGAGAMAVEATGALTVAGAASTTSSLIGRAGNLTTMVGNTRFAGDIQVNLADAGAAATSGTVNAYAGTFTLSSGNASYTLTNDKIAATSLLFVTCVSGAVAQSVYSFIPGSGSAVLTLSGNAGANAKFAFLVVNPGA